MYFNSSSSFFAMILLSLTLSRLSNLNGSGTVILYLPFPSSHGNQGKLFINVWMSGFALDLFSDYGHVLKDTAPETWIDPGIEGVPLQVKNPSIYFQVCLPKCAFSIL